MGGGGGRIDVRSPARCPPPSASGLRRRRPGARSVASLRTWHARFTAVLGSRATFAIGGRLLTVGGADGVGASGPSERFRFCSPTGWLLRSPLRAARYEEQTSLPPALPSST